MVRGAVRIHVDGDTAVRGVQDRSEGGELGVGLGRERRDFRRGLVADRHPVHGDPLGGAALGVDRRPGDAGDDVHPVGHLAPDGVLPVEPRLVDDADEELRAAAARLSGNQHRRDRAPHVPGVAELDVDQAETALTVLRGAFRIGRERVAALDDAVGHHAVEGGAVEVPVPGELHHQTDVVGSQVRPQIDGDRAAIGLEDRLLAAHLLERERGDEGFGGLPGERRGRGQPGKDRESAPDAPLHSKQHTGFHLHTSP